MTITVRCYECGWSARFSVPSPPFGVIESARRCLPPTRAAGEGELRSRLRGGERA
jgi:hypothetical protein